MDLDPAFEKLATAAVGDLTRLAYLLTRNRAEAEDLVQATLERAVSRSSRILLMDFPNAYLRKILTSIYVTWRRRKLASEIIGFDHVDKAVPDISSDVVERDRMWTLLNELPARQRAVVVMRYYLELEDAEIAQMLGCPRTTVRSLAARALRRLRDAIEGHETAVAARSGESP